MSKRYVTHKPTRKSHAGTTQRVITDADVDNALAELESCGLIRREVMPDGEVRLFLPKAPSHSNERYLVLVD
jgi:hypothetical protein